MPTRLAERPRVYVIDDFATSDEMDHVLALGSDPEAVEARGLSTSRDSTGFSFEMPVAGDPILEALTQRIHAVFKMGDTPQPTMRFRRYEASEGHPPHLDNFRMGDTFLLLTALIYLDTTEEGGETAFPRAEPHPVVVRPRRGRLAAWFSHRPTGEVDELSWHEGRAIVKGVKTTITSFVYRPLAVAARRVDGIEAQHGELVDGVLTV